MAVAMLQEPPPVVRLLGAKSIAIMQIAATSGPRRFLSSSKYSVPCPSVTMEEKKCHEPLAAVQPPG